MKNVKYWGLKPIAGRLLGCFICAGIGISTSAYAAPEMQESRWAKGYELQTDSLQTFPHLERPLELSHEKIESAVSALENHVLSGHYPETPEAQEKLKNFVKVLGHLADGLIVRKGLEKKRDQKKPLQLAWQIMNLFWTLDGKDSPWGRFYDSESLFRELSRIRSRLDEINSLGIRATSESKLTEDLSNLDRAAAASALGFYQWAFPKTPKKKNVNPGDACCISGESCIDETDAPVATAIRQIQKAHQRKAPMFKAQSILEVADLLGKPLAELELALRKVIAAKKHRSQEEAEIFYGEYIDALAHVNDARQPWGRLTQTLPFQEYLGPRFPFSRINSESRHVHLNPRQGSVRKNQLRSLGSPGRQLHREAYREDLPYVLKRAFDSIPEQLEWYCQKLAKGEVDLERLVESPLSVAQALRKNPHHVLFIRKAIDRAEAAAQNRLVFKRIMVVLMIVTTLFLLVTGIGTLAAPSVAVLSVAFFWAGITAEALFAVHGAWTIRETFQQNEEFQFLSARILARSDDPGVNLHTTRAIANMRELRSDLLYWGAANTLATLSVGPDFFKIYGNAYKIATRGIHNSVAKSKVAWELYAYSYKLKLDPALRQKLAARLSDIDVADIELGLAHILLEGEGNFLKVHSPGARKVIEEYRNVLGTGHFATQTNRGSAPSPIAEGFSPWLSNPKPKPNGPGVPYRHSGSTATLTKTKPTAVKPTGAPKTKIRQAPKTKSNDVVGAPKNEATKISNSNKGPQAARPEDQITQHLGRGFMVYEMLELQKALDGQRLIDTSALETIALMGQTQPSEISPALGELAEKALQNLGASSAIFSDAPQNPISGEETNPPKPGDFKNMDDLEKLREALDGKDWMWLKAEVQRCKNGQRRFGENVCRLLESLLAAREDQSKLDWKLPAHIQESIDDFFERHRYTPLSNDELMEALGNNELKLNSQTVEHLRKLLAAKTIDDDVWDVAIDILEPIFTEGLSYSPDVLSNNVLIVLRALLSEVRPRRSADVLYPVREGLSFPEGYAETLDTKVWGQQSDLHRMLYYWFTYHSLRHRYPQFQSVTYYASTDPQKGQKSDFSELVTGVLPKLLNGGFVNLIQLDEWAAVFANLDRHYHIKINQMHRRFSFVEQSYQVDFNFLVEPQSKRVYLVIKDHVTNFNGQGVVIGPKLFVLEELMKNIDQLDQYLHPGNGQDPNPDLDYRVVDPNRKLEEAPRFEFSGQKTSEAPSKTNGRKDPSTPSVQYNGPWSIHLPRVNDPQHQTDFTIAAMRFLNGERDMATYLPLLIHGVLKKGEQLTADTPQMDQTLVQIGQRVFREFVTSGPDGIDPEILASILKLTNYAFIANREVKNAFIDLAEIYFVQMWSHESNQGVSNLVFGSIGGNVQRCLDELVLWLTKQTQTDDTQAAILWMKALKISFSGTHMLPETVRRIETDFWFKMMPEAMAELETEKSPVMQLKRFRYMSQLAYYDMWPDSLTTEILPFLRKCIDDGEYKGFKLPCSEVLQMTSHQLSSHGLEFFEEISEHQKLQYLAQLTDQDHRNTIERLLVMRGTSFPLIYVDILDPEKLAKFFDINFQAYPEYLKRKAEIERAIRWERTNQELALLLNDIVREFPKQALEGHVLYAKLKQASDTCTKIIDEDFDIPEACAEVAHYFRLFARDWFLEYGLSQSFVERLEMEVVHEELAWIYPALFSTPSHDLSLDMFINKVRNLIQDLKNIGSEDEADLFLDLVHELQIARNQKNR